MRHAIRRLLRELLKQAIEAADDSSVPIGRRVHEVRAALKKARALLKLVGSLPGRRGSEERRALADVAGWLGSVRDAAIVLETFDGLARMSLIQMSSMSALRLRLDARRRRLEESSRVERDLRRAGQALRRARERAKGLLRRGDARRALSDGFVRGYRKAREAMEEAYRRDAPEAFHAWRKAVKAHAFHVKVLAGAGVKELEPRGELLDFLGTALGEAHDLALLERTIQTERACFTDARAYRSLLVMVRKRQQRIYREVRPQGRRLFVDPAQCA